MPYLEPHQYPIAQPLFERLGQFHLCSQAVLSGMHPGKVWVDDSDHPRVGLLTGPEGTYLAGDPDLPESFAELREIFPYHANLLVDPLDWEPVLDQVWKSRAVRRHYRQHYVFRQAQAPAWRDQLPEGFRAVRVDADFLKRTHLENFGQVEGWMEDWHSPEYFFEHGSGVCMVCGETIASWSLMDGAVGDRCEIGIMTDPKFRRRGLARLAVSALLEDCLARGYRQIGWHCLRSNAGSIATACRVGFVKERDYVAFSHWLPAENPGDMPAEEYVDWAEHNERAGQSEVWWYFQAAQAWAVAGTPQRALENLRRVIEGGWKARPEWVHHNWRLDSIRAMPEFQELIVDLVLTEENV